MIVALSKIVLRAAGVGIHVTQHSIGSPWNGFCSAYRMLTGDKENPLEGASFPARSSGASNNDHHRQAALRAMNR